MTVEVKHPKDSLSAELEEQDGIMFEQTRYTVLMETINTRKTAMLTNIDKRDFPKIMRMLTWVRLYLAEMRYAMRESEVVKEGVYADVNLYLQMIVDYIELRPQLKGERARDLFDTLRGEEKAERRFGGLLPAKKKEDEYDD